MIFGGPVYRKNSFGRTRRPKDYGKAYYWLSNGGADSNPHAMNALGNMYADGKSVKVDDKKAVVVFKSREKWLPVCQIQSGGKIQNGRGSSQGSEKSKGSL